MDFGAVSAAKAEPAPSRPAVTRRERRSFFMAIAVWDYSDATGMVANVP
jgi:hypothetical protein